MRVLVLVLAILLLPLRGWLGDAMAVQAVPGQSAMAANDDADLHAMHSMDGMSHGDAAPHGHHAPQQQQPSSSSHDCQTTCSNCQLCHSVAMSFPMRVPQLNAPSGEAPATAVAAFASAEPARGFKPPIS